MWQRCNINYHKAAGHVQSLQSGQTSVRETEECLTVTNEEPGGDNSDRASLCNLKIFSSDTQSMKKTVISEGGIFPYFYIYCTRVSSSDAKKSNKKQHMQFFSTRYNFEEYMVMCLNRSFAKLNPLLILALTQISLN